MTNATASATGFDAGRLAAIDAFLKARYLDTGLLPHAQLLIARDGEIVHFSHQGAAREGGAPIDDRSLFRIASMTKPITAIGIMMLADENHLRVTDDVEKHLPEFKSQMLVANREFDTVTLKKPARRNARVIPVSSSYTSRMPPSIPILIYRKRLLTCSHAVRSTFRPSWL